jgi:oligopeptide/dipeptide ABC transporter ATP-binding protein
MVFQEPGSALNPVFTIGEQITEVILLHRRRELAGLAARALDPLLDVNPKDITGKLLRPLRALRRNVYQDISENRRRRFSDFIEGLPVARRITCGLQQEAAKIAMASLNDVGIPDAGRIMKQYPHELSGGMKQRVVIAIALCCSSKLIIADEPTTSLDVTIQVQILELLQKLKSELNSSLLYITHNLGVAAEICDRVAVMYAGNICEVAPVVDIFKEPLHPYTRALMAAVPRPGTEPRAIAGYVPDAFSLPGGCHFHPRCDRAGAACRRLGPPLTEVIPGHFVACHLHQGEKDGSSY